MFVFLNFFIIFIGSRKEGKESEEIIGKVMRFSRHEAP